MSRRWNSDFFTSALAECMLFSWRMCCGMTFTIDIAVTKEMPMCVYVTAEFPQQLLLLLSLTRIAVDFHLVRGSKG